MNAISNVNIHDGVEPVLEMLETPWGFRLRPAKIDNKRVDALIEWTLTGLGVALILAAIAQWLLPKSLPDRLVLGYLKDTQLLDAIGLAIGYHVKNALWLTSCFVLSWLQLPFIVD